MSRPSPGYIVFDVDGTLVDSMPLHADAFASAFIAQHEADPSELRRFYLASAGIPLEDQFRAALDRYSPASDGGEIAQMMADFWAETEGVAAVAFPGATEMAGTLHDAGYRLFAISGSKPSAVVSKLTSTGLAESFDLMLGSEPGPEGSKKGPRHLYQIRESLGLSAQSFTADAILVGDAAFDIELANDEGLLAAWVAGDERTLGSTSAKPDFVLRHVNELLPLLKPAGGFVRVRELRRPHNIEQGHPR